MSARRAKKIRKLLRIASLQNAPLMQNTGTGQVRYTRGYRAVYQKVKAAGTQGVARLSPLQGPHLEP